MTPVRINLDRISAPLWCIAIGTLLFAGVSLYSVVRLELAMREFSDAMENIAKSSRP